MQITPPAISLAEYTLYSPLLCWYFCCRVSSSSEDEFYKDRHRRVTWGSQTTAWCCGMGFRCYAPGLLGLLLLLAMYNSITSLSLIDVMLGQWPLRVIYFLLFQDLAIYLCVIESLFCISCGSSGLLICGLGYDMCMRHRALVGRWSMPSLPVSTWPGSGNPSGTLLCRHA